MGKSLRDVDELAALKNARVDHALRVAIVAAVLSDSEIVFKFLDLPDAELGRRLKDEFWRVAGVITVYRYDPVALRTEGEELRKRYERVLKSKAKATGSMTAAEAANPERYPLVVEGKLLREEDFCKAAEATMKKLEKDAVAGRIFSVEFGKERFYPAFLLTNCFERNLLTRVLRRLDGLSGWQKWDFLTGPLESQEGSTPLQLLMVDSMKQVLRAADDFVIQAQHEPSTRSLKNDAR